MSDYIKSGPDYLKKQVTFAIFRNVLAIFSDIQRFLVGFQQTYYVMTYNVINTIVYIPVNLPLCKTYILKHTN